MARGYILIQTNSGMASQVCSQVASVEGVKQCDLVTGPYDIIALVEASDFNTCGHLVLDQIQKIDGIWRTMTALAVE